MGELLGDLTDQVQSRLTRRAAGPVTLGTMYVPPNLIMRVSGVHFLEWLGQLRICKPTEGRQTRPLYRVASQVKVASSGNLANGLQLSISNNGLAVANDEIPLRLTLRPSSASRGRASSARQLGLSHQLIDFIASSNPKLIRHGHRASRSSSLLHRRCAMVSLSLSDSPSLIRTARSRRAICQL